VIPIQHGRVEYSDAYNPHIYTSVLTAIAALFCSDLDYNTFMCQK